MRKIETIVYTIDTHPDKSKIFKYIRENWHDLNNHSLDELVESINALHKLIGGSVDYSISATPTRGEFISFSNYDKAILRNLNPDDYPLTGCFWDALLIEALEQNYLKKVLEVIHKETESKYSKEALIEHCRANNYEFTEDGKFYS